MPRRFPFRFVDPAVMAIEQAAIIALPGNVARQENVMPVTLNEGILEVAVEDPADFALLDKLRFVCNCRIKPASASPNAIRIAVVRYYGPDVG